jgi:hypothetical protein
METAYGSLVDRRDETGRLHRHSAAVDQLRALNEERREFAGLRDIEGLDAEFGGEAVCEGEGTVGLVDKQAAASLRVSSTSRKSMQHLHSLVRFRVLDLNLRVSTAERFDVEERYSGLIATVVNCRH